MISKKRFLNACLLLPFLLVACSPASAPNPNPDPNPNPVIGPWVMGYIAGYEKALLPPDELNWASLTHIAVGRMEPTAAGGLTSTFDIDAQQGPAWAKSVVAKARQNNVKTILMLGGAGAHDAFVAAASAGKRATLVQNIIKAVDEYGFDGVDLDWEPINPADEAPLKALAQALKAAKPGLLLTLPVEYVNINFPAMSVRPSLGALSEPFDRVNIMSYNMAADFEGWYSWHASPLYGEKANTPTSVDSSVKAFLNAGIPAAKLGVGVGFYGQCFTGVTAPNQNKTGMKIIASDGATSYSKIVNDLMGQAQRVWDAAAKAPYLTANQPFGGCNYLSYEDEESVALKGAYARSKGLGGAIIWTLGQGHFSNKPAGQRDPLLDAVYKAFRP